MTRAIDAGLDLHPDDVAAVLAAELAYFEAIGAVGPAVPEPLELLAAEEEATGRPAAAARPRPRYARRSIPRPS